MPLHASGPGIFRATHRAIALALVAAFFVAVVVMPGCSSEDTASCDDGKCAPGNKCLPLNGETKCRKVCSSNIDPTTSCPIGYTCVAQPNGVEPFCVQDNGAPTPKKTGQWGFPCNPTNGIASADCDTAQDFYCNALSPTDGDAYCTRYNCTTDRDCAAGFYCGTANVAPNAETARRTINETQMVCLRRTYCAPCVADLDCPRLDGRVQNCVTDDSGAGLCSPECEVSSNCNNEARCADFGDGLKVCYPRSNLCVGDGSLCSPCRSDADCGDDGICVKGQYTTERACAKKAPKSCDGGDSTGGCPKSADGVDRKIYCLGGKFDTIPADYCHGIYEVGSQPADIGCWTPDR